MTMSTMILHLYPCFAGTHGTGITFGNYASMVTRLELVTGKGDILFLSANENPEIFKAAGVSTDIKCFSSNYIFYIAV